MGCFYSIFEKPAFIFGSILRWLGLTWLGGISHCRNGLPSNSSCSSHRLDRREQWIAKCYWHPISISATCKYAHDLKTSRPLILGNCGRAHITFHTLRSPQLAPLSSPLDRCMVAYLPLDWVVDVKSEDVSSVFERASGGSWISKPCNEEQQRSKSPMWEAEAIVLGKPRASPFGSRMPKENPIDFISAEADWRRTYVNILRVSRWVPLNVHTCFL
jgi:hypothetical protein